MDDPLRADQVQELPVEEIVLILVVMDDPLRVILTIRLWLEKLRS